MTAYFIWTTRFPARYPPLMKKLSGEQWRTLVGKRVFLVENPDNRLDVTTRGPMPARQSQKIGNEKIPNLASRSSPLLKWLLRSGSSNYCSNCWYRTNEFLFVEELGKATPIKKPKGDDPKAPAYANA